MDLPEVGTRLSHSGNIGTVRFLGPVYGTQGTWIGVEWDDPSRGKHSGTKDGIAYFTCSIPDSGSFIRPSSKISYGVSFLEALKAKYIEAYHGKQETIILGSSNGAIEVEAVNLDKIRGKFADLTRLREVSLDNELVASCDAPPGTIRQACPNIRGLDLSRSLIPSWDVVADIAAELPNLQRLALNYTRLQPPRDPARLPACFPRLTELLLNATRAPWAHMQALTARMPRLEAVEMAYNGLTDLAPAHGAAPATDARARDSASALASNSCATAGTHPAIRALNLEGNACADWALVCARLQQLQRLTLAGNGIQGIPLRADGDAVPALRSLQHLSLTANGIKTWSDIDALHVWCPALESLSLAENPIMGDGEQAIHARLFVIARVPTLTQLDGSGISPKDRADSELFYISHVAAHTFPSPAARDAAHPQYRRLCEKHGTAPDATPAARPDRQNLRDRLIELKLYPLDAPPDTTFTSPETTVHALDTAPPLTLRVLPTLPLKALKQRQGATKATKQRGAVRLWLRMHDGAAELVDDAEDLAWLGLEEGSVLFLWCT
ncbi:hypothetical protein HDZ31DRAFT_45613 [Schizophyllum fasciatum]